MSADQREIMPKDSTSGSHFFDARAGASPARRGWLQGTVVEVFCHGRCDGKRPAQILIEDAEIKHAGHILLTAHLLLDLAAGDDVIFEGVLIPSGDDMVADQFYLTAPALDHPRYAEIVAAGKRISGFAEAKLHSLAPEVIQRRGRGRRPGQAAALPGGVKLSPPQKTADATLHWVKTSLGDFPHRALDCLMDPRACLPANLSPAHFDLTDMQAIAERLQHHMRLLLKRTVPERARESLTEFIYEEGGLHQEPVSQESRPHYPRAACDLPDIGITVPFQVGETALGLFQSVAQLPAGAFWPKQFLPLAATRRFFTAHEMAHLVQTDYGFTRTALARRPALAEAFADAFATLALMRDGAEDDATLTQIADYRAASLLTHGGSYVTHRVIHAARAQGQRLRQAGLLEEMETAALLSLAADIARQKTPKAAEIRQFHRERNRFLRQAGLDIPPDPQGEKTVPLYLAPAARHAVQSALCAGQRQQMGSAAPWLEEAVAAMDRIAYHPQQMTQPAFLKACMENYAAELERTAQADGGTQQVRSLLVAREYQRLRQPFAALPEQATQDMRSHWQQDILRDFTARIPQAPKLKQDFSCRPPFILCPPRDPQMGMQHLWPLAPEARLQAWQKADQSFQALAQQAAQSGKRQDLLKARTALTERRKIGWLLRVDSQSWARHAPYLTPENRKQITRDARDDAQKQLHFRHLKPRL